MVRPPPMDALLMVIVSFLFPVPMVRRPPTRAPLRTVTLSPSLPALTCMLPFTRPPSMRKVSWSLPIFTWSVSSTSTESTSTLSCPAPISIFTLRTSVTAAAGVPFTAVPLDARHQERAGADARRDLDRVGVRIARIVSFPLATETCTSPSAQTRPACAVRSSATDADDAQCGHDRCLQGSVILTDAGRPQSVLKANFSCIRGVPDRRRVGALGRRHRDSSGSFTPNRFAS
jgi:hypothetical protein